MSYWNWKERMSWSLLQPGVSEARGSCATMTATSSNSLLKPEASWCPTIITRTWSMKVQNSKRSLKKDFSCIPSSMTGQLVICFHLLPRSVFYPVLMDGIFAINEFPSLDVRTLQKTTKALASNLKNTS